jgi:hypothetical protein
MPSAMARRQRESDHDVFDDAGVVQLNISDMAADAAGTAFMLMMLP